MSRTVFLAAAILLALFFVPAVEAQLKPITLSSDFTSGTASEEYRMEVSWDLANFRSDVPDATDVRLQYRKDGASTWSELTRISFEKFDVSTTKRNGIFRIAPSEYGLSASGKYQFRVLDKQYDTSFYNDPSFRVAESNSITMSFGATSGSASCKRSWTADGEFVPGTGYTINSKRKALVDVGEGNSLGTGSKFRMQISITNGNSGCGTATYKVSVNEEAADDRDPTDRDDATRWTVVSGERTGIITVAEGKTQKIVIEVEAGSEIAPGREANSIVTVSAVDTKARSKFEGSSDVLFEVLASTIRKCDDEDPRVSVTPKAPNGRTAGRSQEAWFLVTVENPNNQNGCSAKAYSIDTVGVQRTDQQNRGEETVVPVIMDTSVNSWKFEAFHYKLGQTAETVKFSPSGDFTKLGAYKGHRASPRIDFNLANLGKKYIILRVTAPKSDNSGGRSIAVCVDGTSFCDYSKLNILPLGQVTQITNTYAALGVTEADLKRAEPTGVTVRDKTTKEAPKVGPSPKSPSAGVQIAKDKAGLSGLAGGRGQTVSSVSGIDTAFFQACKACTLQPRMGFKVAPGGKTGKCLPGKVDKSDDGTAERLKGTWIYYPLERARLQVITDTARRSNTYSCEKPPAGVGVGTGTETVESVSVNREESGSAGPVSISANAPKTSFDVAKCRECVVRTGMGFNTEKNSCERGNYIGSSVSTASAKKGNWVRFLDDASREEKVSAKAAPAESMVCGEPPKTTTGDNGAVIDETVQAVGPSTNSQCPSLAGTCATCALLRSRGCGWDAVEDKCKSGNDLKSDDGKASVSGGNWVRYYGAEDPGSGSGLHCQSVK